MERHAIDKTAYQRLPAGPSQFRANVEVARQRQRAALAGEQMARREIGPPRHLIEPAQHRVDFAAIAAKPAAFDRRKHVALQQHALDPARRQHCGIIFGQAHEMLTPPLLGAGYRQSSDRDRPAPARSSPASSPRFSRCRAALCRRAFWWARWRAAETARN